MAESVCRTDHLKKLLLVESMSRTQYNESTVSDHTWDAWAKELIERQAMGLDTDFHRDVFEGLEGATACDLYWRLVRAGG